MEGRSLILKTYHSVSRGLNEVTSAMICIRSFFRRADVAARAFIEDKMVPRCVEVVQKFKRHQDPESASPWYGVSVRCREILNGKYVACLRAEEVPTRYFNVEEYTLRYSEGLSSPKKRRR